MSVIYFQDDWGGAVRTTNGFDASAEADIHRLRVARNVFGKKPSVFQY
jgi:hypothetical protein